MARAYILRDEDFSMLLNSLELLSLQRNNLLRHADEIPTKEEMHRAFWYVVVRWAQAQGFDINNLQR